MDSNWIGLSEDITQIDCVNNDEWIDINEETTPSLMSIHRTQSRLSTTSSIRIDSYEEVTRNKAGEILLGGRL
jgi:hypothetical protein